MNFQDKINKMLGSSLVEDKEYDDYVKKKYPNSKRVQCPICGTFGYSHWKYCDQCGV